VRRTFSAVGGVALAIGALLLALLASSQYAGARPDAADQAGSLVAFQSDRDGDSEIWVVSDSGGQPRRLTNNRVADATPAWTPDGERIVFASTRHGNWELYSMTARGTDVTRLTRTHADEFDPVVSPDGRRIAFESNARRNWDIFVMGIDGGDQRNMTGTPANDFDPAWSPNLDPDNARIAFSTGTRRNYDIAVVPADAPGRISRITDDDSSDLDPNWSTQDEIVFTRRAGATRDLFVVNSGGSGLRDVATGPTDDWGAVWADNGRIVFVRETDPLKRASPYRIFVMDRDGSRQQLLVRGGQGVDVEPAPQPGSNPRFTLVGAVRALASAATSHCRRIYGNDNPNNLVGTVNKDCMYGRGAKDTVRGQGAGDPELRGGPGADTVKGEGGDDRHYVVDGEPDVVDGGAGAGDEAWVDEDAIDTVISATIH
jgi:Tol biopolymer transport system component